MAETGAIRFEEVLQAEMNEIEAARNVRSGGNLVRTPDEQLVGLAFSGGGVRSATFNLGVLQGLSRFDFLRRIDYLSSAGGGSYIAGWLASWLRRSGFKEVEAQLSGAKASSTGRVEAPEIQQLRKATGYLLSSTGLSGGSGAVLTWLRNVALNLTILSSILGAFLLSARAFIWWITLIPYHTLWSLPIAIILLATIATVFLRVLARSSVPETAGRPFRDRIFGAAAASILAAAMLFGVYISAPMQELSAPWGLSRIFLACGLAVMYLVGWMPRVHRMNVLLVSTLSAAVAGAAGGLIFFLGLRLWLLQLLPRTQILFATPLTISAILGAGLVYLFMVDRWISRQDRDLAVRMAALLTGAALVWIFVVGVWGSWLDHMRLFPYFAYFALPAWAVLVMSGLVNARARFGLLLQGLFNLLTYVAPFCFVTGLSLLVVTALKRLLRLTYGTYPFTGSFELLYPPYSLREAGFAAGLLIIALFLMWRAGANEFSMQNYYLRRIVRTFLSPSVAAETARTKPNDRVDDDLYLSDLAVASNYTGPYLLLGAAVNVIETDTSGLKQTNTLPFFFAPKYSGFEPSEVADKRDSRGGFRRTREFAGGISLGTAMAIAGPVRRESARPPSAAAAFLWKVFDVSSGWWVGNPHREDTWQRSGPRSGLAYSLFERFSSIQEPGYVYLTDVSELDNLAIYQLVKRRCRFIIACDASGDAGLTFEDLGETIKKCRTDFGVEIEIDIAPLSRVETAFQRTHCTLGLVRYRNGDPGILLYVKPSLTGDEPSDLLQYSSVHRTFPLAPAATAEFDESEFESYRRLGQHIMESLLVGVSEHGTLASMPTGKVFSVIGQRLLPGKYQQSEQAAPAPRPPSDPPKGLVDAIASRECVLCAGPGLAAQAGLPTWGQFLEGLLRFGREKNVIDADSFAGLSAAVAAHEYEAAADELTHQLPRDMLFEYVRSSITDVQPSQAHRILAELPFMGALNTNFDTLFGAAFNDKKSRSLVPSDAEELVDAIRAKTFFLLNVLGSTLQPTSLLFTAKEFRTLLVANLQLKQSLVTLFQRYSLFFLGSSIKGIRAYLDTLELAQRPDHRHYAVVAVSGELDPVELRYLDRTYNIQIIDYLPRTNYPELPSFLQKLLSAVRQKQPAVEPSARPILQSVSLVNIGPFDTLDLDLTASWNVLLGDNGVGKTVVLRAIAASLCGDAAEQAVVARLLRTGSPSGSIRLSVGTREYRVELKRDSDDRVRIESVSLSPLKLDNWLVLGFPALRSIPLDTPRGPSETKSKVPSADDLLPILTGQPDTRISNLKQWIVNLDYAASRSDVRTSNARKLLNRFFDVLQRLTPDMRLKLDSINPKTMQIMIDTDAGTVPLEVLSQGTGSVMCWIGALLERLYEVHVSLDDPEQGGALVLIDEIDAHMHPKWQQSIVGNMKEIFPNVQFLATTHSPLIVVGLEQRELYLIRRELPDAVSKSHVTASRPDHSLRGWGADQVLTGELFGLPTLLDPRLHGEVDRYTELAAKEHPTKAEEQELKTLAEHLKIKRPSPKQREEARLAFQMIERALEQQLLSIPAEKRRKILDEAKVQMEENITGFRRPE